MTPREGTVLLNGRKVSGLKPRALRPFRRQMQVVFQDPYASLDPRMTVREIIGEPLRINGCYSARAGRRTARACRPRT